ncbi:hypothetical protein D3C80_1869310 [compost metagenome]
MACESSLAERVWKYLMPPPLAILVILPSMVVTRPSMTVTASLVAFSCAPFTASVLVSLSTPAAMLVIF